MKTSTARLPRPAFVRVAGPYPDFNRDGDEFPYWVVGCTDENGEDVGHKMYTCRTYEAAMNLTDRIARDRRLEIICDASIA